MTPAHRDRLVNSARILRQPWLALAIVLAVGACRQPTGGSRPDATSPHAGAAGTLEGTITLTGPMPPRVPIQLDSETARQAGCSAAAQAYAAPLGVTQPGLMPEALVTVDVTTRIASPPPPRRRYAMFHDCSISPRLLVMNLGDELVLRAYTNEHHLPKVEGLGATIAQLLQRNEDQVKHPTRPGRYILHSINFPDWMQTPVIVLPRNPFYDQADAHGHFRIESLPAGTYTAHAWFPGTRPTDITVTIRPGQVTRQDFAITPAPPPPVVDAGPPVDAGPIPP